MVAESLTRNTPPSLSDISRSVASCRDIAPKYQLKHKRWRGGNNYRVAVAKNSFARICGMLQQQQQQQSCHRSNNNTWLETNSVSSLAPLKYFSTLNYFPAAMFQPIIALPFHLYTPYCIQTSQKNGSLLSERFVTYDHNEDGDFLFTRSTWSYHCHWSLTNQLTASSDKYYNLGDMEKIILYHAVNLLNWKELFSSIVQDVKEIKYLWITLSDNWIIDEELSLAVNCWNPNCSNNSHLDTNYLDIRRASTLHYCSVHTKWLNL